MTVAIGGAALLGAVLRLLYGGAPHRPDPTDASKQLRGWLGKGTCYVLFLALGIVAAIPLLAGVTWLQLSGYAIVSLIIAAGWNPGHGSYLAPGDGARDNESVAPIVKAIAPMFGWSEGSVGYSCLGMGVRYGLVSILAAGIMVLCGVFVQKPWLDPVYHNGPFELAIGALMYGALPIATMSF